MSTSKDVLRGDGSSALDARERVEVDRQRWPWRWTCPRGHPNWDRTNNHIWCPGCRREAENGADVDPEHYEIFDKRRDETIPWSAVEIVEEK